MPGLLQRLLPREEGFFDLFDKQADNIVVGAKALLRMLEHYTGVPEQAQEIKAIEHNGDEITHAVLTKLNQTFITPLDREDIHELCSRLDDVIDLIDAAASRFVLYRVSSIREGTVDLVKVLVGATEEVATCVHALITPENRDEIYHRDQSLRERKRPHLPHADRTAVRRRKRPGTDHQMEGNFRSHRNRRRQMRGRRQCNRKHHPENRLIAGPCSNFSLLIVVGFLTLAFEFSNGWHDAANSIATVVSTRVLTPFRAVAWAAFWNFIAAFVFGTAVAETIGKGMVHIEMVNQRVLLAGLVGAIIWN